MKYSLAAAALFAGVFAAKDCPAPQPTPQKGYFTAISARSTSPIHLLALQANGGKFYLGGESSATCPTGTKNCPTQGFTSFIGGDGSLSLGSVVGQQVYVASDGTLAYTSAQGSSLPAGAIGNQFTKTDPQGSTLGSLSFQTGFVACPQADGRYQIFGKRDGVSFASACLGFNVLTSNTDGPTAYQF